MIREALRMDNNIKEVNELFTGESFFGSGCTRGLRTWSS